MLVLILLPSGWPGLERNMEIVLYRTDLGECGIDPSHSPGVGSYYVKLYDGTYDACGFDTLDEARAELEFLTGVEE